MKSVGTYEYSFYNYKGVKLFYLLLLKAIIIYL